MSNNIKSFNQAAFDVKLKNLNYLATLIKESDTICKAIADVKTLAEVELKLNEKSGFVNSQMSAAAYGFEKEYSRVLEIEKLTKGDLNRESLTSNYSLKQPFLSEVKDEFTVYYTDKETEVIKVLDAVMVKYNSLDLNYRNAMGIDRQHKLRYYPGNNLRKN